MAHELDLISFFAGTEVDYRGRKLSDILAWPDDHLELSHDYIQTIFPLPEESRINWNATIVDRKVFDAFHSQPELRAKLREAFVRMLSFYGLKWLPQAEAISIVPGDNFQLASENWVHRFDHNHLRITRIIRSLRVLGLEEEALAFFQALKLVQEASNISPKSLNYWSRAAFRPLYIAPDVDSDDEESVRGPKFLRDFEKKRHKLDKVQKNDEQTRSEENGKQTRSEENGKQTRSEENGKQTRSEENGKQTKVDEIDEPTEVEKLAEHIEAEIHDADGIVEQEEGML